MFSEKLLTRFLQYVKTHTTSNQNNADKGIQPSSEIQRAFAKQLVAELKSFNIDDVSVTDHSYVCARIKASKGYEKCSSVGFLAHLDTVEEVPGENVNPQLSKTPDGDTIISTDGTTLLGADDKAGIAIIMTAVEKILADNIPHGQIEIIFSPDEETGHGMDNVPIEWIQSKQCYTVDGGTEAEIEAECFNAYKSVITFTGKAMHTGTARPNMVNAVTMASNFITLLPQNESPEATDDRLGFYAPMEISGSMESASVTLYLRDFSIENMKKRLTTIETFAKAIEAKFVGGKIGVKHTQQYLNMKEKLDENPHVMASLVQAVKNVGLEPVFKSIRGGTDGSRLTEMGIPTPNIFTGGHDFHSRSEWASLKQMKNATLTIIELVKIYCAGAK